MRPLDPSLLEAGYLTAPAGKPRPRHILSMDLIAQDAAAAGAVLYWQELPGGLPGACAVRERLILLAPWLWQYPPWFIRLVASEELAHCYVGPSEDRARAWQRARYGSELLEPV